ncbi:PhzF family phenazine biosynthesis protein [Dysgonomonas sp. ZJ709]|uniref:PhzF family phenazine biosynthesis protein n=1 Tax=Dysgonomonas sp. ZJ709 TaxID=2709797 RepID=UPI0013EB717B|nr:PhzF family phenazine biosynthesis protein [Dysgonomonas sp. ZJ709]
MEKLRYLKLDAFIAGESNGNPAACIYLEKDQILSESDMQNIAKEHKGFVSEVIYCAMVDSSSCNLRYYSSECEVDFCGHGTIACMYHLLKTDEQLKQLPEIKINTKKGSLVVYNELQSLDAVFITAPNPEYLSVTVAAEEISENLGVIQNMLDKQYPINFINAGLRTLIIPITNLDNILALNPDEETLKAFCITNEIDIILVFTTDVTNENNKIRTRVFAPKFGYLEDVATGSGNSAMGYYMLKHNLWNREPISIEQNGEQNAYNVVKLKMSERKVLFGGSASVKIEGTYFLNTSDK